MSSATAPTASASARRTSAASRSGALLLFAAIYLLPLFVMLVTSFKTLDEIRNGDMLQLPLQPTIEPWLNAWGSACIGLTCEGLKGYFWNSIRMVVPAGGHLHPARRFQRLCLTKWRFPRTG
jgi:glucose/mannose transport system permease protein